MFIIYNDIYNIIYIIYNSLSPINEKILFLIAFDVIVTISHLFHRQIFVHLFKFYAICFFDKNICL